jgi:hypothetical protein
LKIIKTNKFKENWIHFWYFCKAFDEWDFFGGDFLICKLKVQEILNFELFLSLKIQYKFNQIKTENFKILIWPMAHATLVCNNV